MAFDAALAERVRLVLAGLGVDFHEQRMMGVLVFMVRGHMCCGVSGDALMLRLGPEGAAAVLGPQVAILEVGAGRQARGFVTVAPDAVAGEDLRLWLRRALDFVAGLPPKG